MCLAEPGASVDEEGVIRLRRRFGDGERGRVREAIRRADHEGVERVLRLESAALGPGREGLDHGKDTIAPRPMLRRGLFRVSHAQLERMTLAGDVAHRRVQETTEMPVNPVARKLVRNGEDQCLALALEVLDTAEPLTVRAVVQGLSEPYGDLTPKVLRRQLDLVSHARSDPPSDARRPA